MTTMTDILTIDLVSVGATAATKEDAIMQAGQLLVQNGVVSPSYVEGMLAREQTMSTFLGNGVSIPHGTYDHLGDIERTGISVVQFPNGVSWGEDEDEIAYLVVGIAAKADEHITILSNLAEVVEDEAAVERLISTTDAQIIVDALSRQPELE